MEGFRRVLERHAAGKRIEAVEVLDRSMLQGTTPQALERALKGNRFRKPARHGKWLVAPVGEVEVLMHFGMTGLLDWRPRGEQRQPHDRIVFV